jgi:integrase
LSQSQSLAVDESKAYFNFINSIKSEYTKRNYRDALLRFLQHYQMDIRTLAKTSPKDIEALLIDYIVYLKRKKRSLSLLNLITSAITHFCVMNDINILTRKINKFKGENEISGKSNDRAYSSEEIQSLVNVSPLRMKMVFLILASTGQRIGSLPLLRLKHLKKIEDVYEFTIYANSPNQRYVTYCTPECTQMIDKYLQYRERFGEVLTGDSFLIRQDFDINDLEQIKKQSKPIALGTLRGLVRNYLIKVGVRVPMLTGDNSARHEVAQNHGFRKFTEFRLIESDVNPMAVLRLVGHKGGLDNKSYFRPKPGFLLSEYEKAIDALTINPENRLRRKVAKLEIEKSKFDILSNELDQIKKAMRLQ